jgi:lipid II:glycine glycyltransferase (peptidoglycan interpeptide bridge formation enzyme)
MERPTILSRNQLPSWDKFVHSHDLGWICHLSSWKEVLARTTRIKACYYLAIVDEDTSEIKAGLPIYQIQSLTLNKKLIAAPLTTIYDPLVANQAQLNLLLKMGQKLALSSGCSELRIKALHMANLFNDPALIKDNTFRYHYLDLRQDLDVLWKRAHRSCIRQQVNKAQKNGVQIRLASNKEELNIFYRLYALTRKRHGLPAIPYVYFETIWDIYQPIGYAYFLLAQYHNATITALMAFRFKDRFSAEAIGWDERYRWLTPSAITFWEAIKLARQLGCQSFDFGRTSIYNESLITFKRHWGTEEMDMPQFSWSNSKKALPDQPPEKKSLKKLSPVFFFKNSPNFIFHKISNFYYKYFSK